MFLFVNVYHYFPAENVSHKNVWKITGNREKIINFWLPQNQKVEIGTNTFFIYTKNLKFWSSNKII